MKVCTIQPVYPKCPDAENETFEYILAQLRQCVENTDLVVLPEYSNIPGLELSKSIIDFAEQYVYNAGCEDVLKSACQMSPEIARCYLKEKCDYSLVENAIRYCCKKSSF